MQKLTALSSVDGSCPVIHRNELPDYNPESPSLGEYQAQFPIGQCVSWFPDMDLWTRERAVIAAVRFSPSESYDIYVQHGADTYRLVENISRTHLIDDYHLAEYEDYLRSIEQGRREGDDTRTAQAWEGIYKREYSAVTVDAQAALDAMALMVWPYVFDTDYEPATLKTLQKLIADAAPFVERHKLGVALWRRVAAKASLDIEESVGPVLIDIGTRVQAQIDRIKTDNSLSATDFAFVRDWQLFMRAGSDPALARIRANVGKVASKAIVKLYADDSAGANAVRAQSAAVARATSLVKRLTGREASKMSLDEAKTARERKPELYKEYLAARREVNAVTKEAIVAITRAASAPVLVSDVIKQLNRSGIEHQLPSGFHGKIDERGYYTLWDEPLDGTPVGDVRMNPSYEKGSSAYVFQTRAEGALTYQTVSTKAAKAARKDQKYAKVADTMQNLETFQKRWRQDLMSRDPDLKELGCITEILFLTASRIGSVGNETNGEATYGLTTLVGANFTCRATTVRIQYRGKKGAAIDHLITAEDRYSREVVRLLKEYVKLVGKTGEVFDVEARDVNQYLKTRIKLPIRAHGFRYMRGTALMQDLLDAQRKKLGKRPNEREVIKAFNTAAEGVGLVLGHTNKKADGTTAVTGATAVKSYIDPVVSRAWFEEFQVRAPLVVEKL